MNSLVSVIVTTKNNEMTIDDCLKSIVSQSYKEIEIIVVDNNSSDRTQSISSKYTTKVYAQGPERSAQRNYGVSKSSGEYVLIIDSDMILSEHVVEECLSAVDDKHMAIIIPEQSFGRGFWAKCKTLERSFYIGVEWIEAPRFYDKSLYVKIGGYNETVSGGEDWELRDRAKQETSFAHINTLILHDEGALTLKEIYESRRYYSKGFSQIYQPENHKSGKSPANQAISTLILFLSKPQLILIHPLLYSGLYIMKIVEFATLALNRNMA